MYVSGGPRPGEPGTLNKLFFDAVEQYDKPDALQFKVNGVFQPISHKTLAQRVTRTALGLRQLGVKRGDRVGLLSENRPEWAIADYGCLTTGVTDVPLFPSLPADQIAYILKDAGAVACFVSNAEQAAKLTAIRAEIPTLKHVIAFAAEKGPGVEFTLAELEALGAAAENAEAVAQHRREALDVKPDDLATLIYTSGTTGAPKGVMLSHDNIFSNVDTVRRLVPFVVS